MDLASRYRSDIAQCEREVLWDMIKSYYEKVEFYLGKAEEYERIILTSYLKDSEIKVPKW